MDVAGAMLVTTGSTLSDMTWLASVTGLLEAFSSGNVSQFESYMKRTGSSITKGFIYPKIVEQSKQMIDDYNNDPRRYSSSMWGKVVKDMPVLQNNFPIQYNALGQPVTVDAINMLDKGTSDPVASFIGKYWKDSGGLGGVRQKSMTVYDVDRKKERPINDVEYMNFVRVSGQEIARRIEQDLMVNEDKLTPLDIGKAITNIKSDVRASVKAGMFGWREWQAADPKFWQILIDNNAVQTPITSKTFKGEDTKRNLTEEELVEYNKITMDTYISLMKEYLADPSSKDDKEDVVDESTRETRFQRKVQGIWSEAKAEAMSEENLEKILKVK
jgi:hypothetical protein